MINPTYSTYNWGYNLLMIHQVVPGGNPEAPELTNELEKLQEMLQSASLELLEPWRPKSLEMEGDLSASFFVILRLICTYRYTHTCILYMII